MSAQADTAGELDAASLPVRRGEWRMLAAARLERDGLVVLVVAVCAITMLVSLKSQLVADGWLALLAGREIVRHGLPGHDTLTVWSHGHRWVDQQWLGQLGLYALSRLGGLRLALVVHAALSTGAFAAAAALARRRGGSARAVVWVALVALILYYPSSSNMRTQSFVYPLFVSILWLLSADSRAQSRRVFVVLPLLVIWANVHGSAVFAAGLVSLYGLLGMFDRARLRRGATLALLPWACLLASPYAPELPHYYRTILFNPAFGQFVSEWQATTLTLVTAPSFLLAGVTLWILGRAGGRYTRFERLALLVTLVLSFVAIRNLVWFGLASLILLPHGLADVLKERETATTQRMNRLLGTLGIVASALILVLVSAHGDGWFTHRYQARAADAVAAAGAGTRVFANEAFADWLMWEHPSLERRLAFDARFELLTPAQVKNVAEFRARVDGWQRATRGYGVLVLDATAERKQARGLLARPGARLLYRDRYLVAIARAA
jgi:hypothetical protein